MLKNLVSTFSVMFPISSYSDCDCTADRKKKIVADILDTIPAVEKSKRERVIEILALRESKGSTGLGRGVAIPHARTESIEKPVIVLAVSPDGIEWDAQDGGKVHLVFLVLVPLEQSELYLKIVTRLSTLVRISGFVESLIKCTSSEEVINRIHDCELELKVKTVLQ
jgi:mannitol/fructose-specific phosphotransferase system IIA component (Ntr-type)